MTTRTMLLVSLMAVSLLNSPLPAKAQPTPIAAQAAALFGQFCLDAPPSFDAIDGRASAAGYQIFQDRTFGAVMHQKEWLVPASSNSQPLLLSVEHGLSRDGVSDITVCGVSSIGASGPDLQQALSADSRLGVPAKVVNPEPNGGVGVFWSVQFASAAQGSEAQAMLAYNVPGLTVNPINLTFKRPR